MQCLTMTQSRRHPPSPPTPCHLRHPQNFNKINIGQKSLLKTLIFYNLIVGWKEGVIKEGAGILHQICRFRRGAKCWGQQDSSI